jgi:hypothetical protein
MSEPTPRKLASEIASLVQKYPGLGQDVFVHEADYNQAANSVVALKAELREVSNSLAHALKWKMELDSVRDTLAAQRTALLDAQAQLAALEAKRREDVRKCAEICNSFSLDPVPQKRIRAAFPEDFK